MRDLSGKHVVVTGGTGFLGTAVVGALLARGAEVHIPAWAPREVARSPHWDDEHVHGSVGVDLTDEDAAHAWFSALPPLWASVQVAGGFAMGPIAETSKAELMKQLQLNTVTCFLACKGAVERIRAAGGGGRLVNVTAGPGLAPAPNMVAYAAAKSGVTAITRSLAEELRADKIFVNAIVPGVMDTPANRAAMPDADRSGWSALPDVAATVAWLASPGNTTTTGSFIHV